VANSGDLYKTTKQALLVAVDVRATLDMVEAVTHTTILKKQWVQRGI
jgi:hypothetical protein